MNQPINIMIVEDEVFIAADIQQTLTALGYNVTIMVSSGEEAIQQARLAPPDLILMDIHLAGQMDGIEAASAIRARQQIPIIYLTADADEAMLARAKITEPFGYLLKPFQERELHITLQIALYKYQMENALKEKNRELEQEIFRRNEVEEHLQQLNQELETRVRMRTLEFERANRELKEFVYAASHDLKTPLRGIHQLTTWMLEDYAKAFDEHWQEMAALLLGKVKRMDGLLDGILRYANVERAAAHDAPILLNQLVKDVVACLTLPEHIQVEISSDLPLIVGDETLFEQVFSHLLNNAVNFMDKPQGEITVTCEENSQDWLFCIADNGPGIAPKYQKKIFKIFQTLAGHDDRKSTGLGLAVVKKIVELYGGSIWVESEVGRGSRFWFTLPR